MNEDIAATGASALTTGHMSDHMSSRIAVVGGRRRWSVDQKLSILREAFGPDGRSEEHTSELQSLMRISYAVFCLKKKIKKKNVIATHTHNLTHHTEVNHLDPEHRTNIYTHNLKLHFKYCVNRIHT